MPTLYQNLKSLAIANVDKSNPYMSKGSQRDGDSV